MHVWCKRATAHLWRRGGNNYWKSVLLFCHVTSGDRIQVVRASSRLLHSLNHFCSPLWELLVYIWSEASAKVDQWLRSERFISPLMTPTTCCLSALLHLNLKKQKGFLIEPWLCSRPGWNIYHFLGLKKKKSRFHTCSVPHVIVRLFPGSKLKFMSCLAQAFSTTAIIITDWLIFTSL